MSVQDRIDHEWELRDHERWDEHERGEHPIPDLDCGRCQTTREPYKAAGDGLPLGGSGSRAPGPSPTPLRLPPGMTFRAGHDQIGHLLAKPRDHWYLCGFQATTLRLAWPMRERCAECVAVLGEGGRA